MPSVPTPRERSASLSAYIKLADPEFYKEKTQTVVYDFSDVGGRKFIANPDTTGIYDESNDL